VRGAKCALVERFNAAEQRKSPDWAAQDNRAVAKRVAKTLRAISSGSLRQETAAPRNFDPGYVARGPDPENLRASVSSPLHPLRADMKRTCRIGRLGRLCGKAAE